MNRRSFLVNSAGLLSADRIATPSKITIAGGLARNEPGADEVSSYNPENVKAWFNQTYFNLVIDYYTEVPQRPYATGYTRQNLLPAFQMARPGYVITYAKGHSGTTAFKSRLHTEHPMLGDDPLVTFREVTREAGVKMFLYYSGLIDGTAGRKHPEWQAVGKDGKPYGGAAPYWMIPVCPISPYFEEWVTVHLEEMMTRYDPDGIWVDGDWGGGGECYNESCRKLCAERFGPEAIHGAEFHLWVRNEFRRKFAAFIRRFKPTCLYSAGNTTPAVDTGLANHMDWQSGDWFTPDYHRIMQSIAMRRYTTLGLPYDAITCDTQYIHGFTEMRSRVKTVDRMKQEGAGVLANGGKWCYWTYPMPNGGLIPSRMRVAKQCHDWADERRDLWLNTQSARWTAAVSNVAAPLWFRHNDSLLGASKALMGLHRSPDLIHMRQLADPIPYEALVLANQPDLTSEQVGKLEKFVQEGGTLLTAGATARVPRVADLLGIKVAQEAAVNEGHVLLKDGTPAGIYRPWDMVELKEAEAWWKLYKSWDQDNPNVKWLPSNYPITGMLDEEHPEEAGFPAVTARRLGRGLAVHISADPFEEYWNYGYPTTHRFLRELMERMQPDPLFSTDAAGWVEVSLRVRAGELLIHFVNTNPGRDMSKTGEKDLFVDEIPMVGPSRAELRCRQQPRSVYLDPGHHDIEHDWHEGRLRFTLPPFHIHCCVRVDPWPA